MMYPRPEDRGWYQPGDPGSSVIYARPSLVSTALWEVCEPVDGDDLPQFRVLNDGLHVAVLPDVGLALMVAEHEMRRDLLRSLTGLHPDQASKFRATANLLTHESASYLRSTAAIEDLILVLLRKDRKDSEREQERNS